MIRLQSLSKFSLLLVAGAMTYQAATAQSAKFGLTLLGNINSGKSHFNTNFGGWESNDSTSYFNFGFEPNVMIYLNEKSHVFLYTGFRILTASTTVTAPERATYDINWITYSVPVRIGKSFSINKNKSPMLLDLFVGGSIGSNSNSSVYMYGVTGYGDNNSAKSRLATNMEVGANWMPFAKNPNFSIGFRYIKDFQNSGNVLVESGVNGIPYKFDVNKKFNNFAITVGYSFGKKWQRQYDWTSPLQCNP